MLDPQETSPRLVSNVPVGGETRVPLTVFSGHFVGTNFFIWEEGKQHNDSRPESRTLTVRPRRLNLNHTKFNYLATVLFILGNNECDVTKTHGAENSPQTDTSEVVGARDKQDTHVTYLRDAHVSQSNGVKTRDCGHRAGFDAFMTGYCMATYLLQLGKESVDNELSLSSLVDVANKLSLTRKDVPLQITRSHFTRPSASHAEKLKRLKNQPESSEQA